MENVSKNDAFRKDGKRKYGKREYKSAGVESQVWTRAHHGDEIPERDLTYHLTCLLIYHGTTIHL